MSDFVTAQDLMVQDLEKQRQYRQEREQKHRRKHARHGLPESDLSESDPDYLDDSELDDLEDDDEGPDMSELSRLAEELDRWERTDQLRKHGLAQESAQGSAKGSETQETAGRSDEEEKAKSGEKAAESFAALDRLHGRRDQFGHSIYEQRSAGVYGPRGADGGIAFTPWKEDEGP